MALSPESEKNKAYNSGVMYLNIQGWIGIYDSLLAYARAANWTFYGGTLQDQGLINEFFDLHHLPLEMLPNEFNWKVGGDGGGKSNAHGVGGWGRAEQRAWVGLGHTWAHVRRRLHGRGGGAGQGGEAGGAHCHSRRCCCQAAVPPPMCD